ncbi:MAG: ATP-binding protein [Acidimicrobiales bacterium]
MTIRTRLLVVAAVPAVALAMTTFLLLSGAPSSKATLAMAVAAAGVVVAVTLAMSVSRTITTPLARLGDAAERASHLQTLVEALRRPGGGEQDLALMPVGLPPGDEIGDVAKAFDEFQGAAARLAVGQAALLNKTVAEKGTVEVFVNLARRMQGLVDHQIEFLDGLEAEEQDPDTLENLFRLDQLATRVRRNAESLLTLAGAASTRSWERPLAMSDVIRAGMAEVEDIARVELLLDDNAAMLGNVAADAAHLLSELIENATRWSPPDTRVDVSGTPAAGGYAVTIEDRGIGMAPEALAEANHILTGPPLAEATVARSLGLVVAGRLARRLGIVVRLAASGSGGIIAKVLVPPTLMVAADGSIDLEEVVAGPARSLPFALARQEKRARISSQRSRGPRPVPGSQPAEATITQIPASRRPQPVAPVEPVQRESHWLQPAAPAEPGWPAAEAERWTEPFGSVPSVEPEMVVAEDAWAPAEQSWSPNEAEWPAADLSWPAAAVADQVPVPDGWPIPAVRDSFATEPVVVPEPAELAVRERAPVADDLAAVPAPWEPAVPPAPVRAAEPARPIAPPASAQPAWQPAVAEEPGSPHRQPVVAEEPGSPHRQSVVADVPTLPAPAPPHRQPVVADVPTLPVRPPRPAPAVEPPAAAAPRPMQVPSVREQFVAPAPPVREPVVAATPNRPPGLQAAPASETPPSIRPTPTVRPARFAASASRPLAAAAPQRATVPSVEAKEDEYRRHLERATAAGLVRRVPKASLPKDTGGGAKRAPKTGGDEPVVERLPDEVRSLLSSYRSGVQRGRADGPSADQQTTTPQEQP